MSLPGPASIHRAQCLWAPGGTTGTQALVDLHTGARCSKPEDESRVGGHNLLMLWLPGCEWGQWILLGSGGDTWNKHAL